MFKRIRQWLNKSDGLDEELAFHLEQLEQDQLSAGIAPAAARNTARKKLGNTTVVRENVFDLSPVRLIDDALRHIRFALRTFGQHSGTYGVAIGILALGIGMSVTIFSLVQAVILRPLPFPQQQSIEVIWKKDLRSGVALVEMAYPELRDLKGNIKAFEFVAMMPPSLYGYGRVIQFAGREPVQIEGTPVTTDFFRVLGVSPILGRDFQNSDEQSGAAPVVILTHRIWREQFAADPNIIGQQVRMNGTGTTVVGVMPPAVEFPRGVGVWYPLFNVNSRLDRRGATFLQAIARVRPGSSRPQMVAQVGALFKRLAQEYPAFYSASQQAVVTPLPDYWMGSARLHLWISLGASLLLLLAACVSVGNLMLSRGLARRHEIATRASLGASSSQITMQFAVEGITAALIATGAGLVLALGTIQVLVMLAPADIPRLSEATLDWQGFTFAAAVSCFASIVCSIAPASLALPRNLDSLLRQGGSRSSGTLTGKRLQDVFVMSQTAITVMLLSMSLLLLLSYRAMMRSDLGFQNTGTVSMNLSFRGRAATPTLRRAFYTTLINRLQESPGVTSAAGVLVRPLEGTVGWDMPYQFEFENGRKPDEIPSANYETITPGYFTTVGLAILEGRDFTTHDDEHAVPVAIISRSLAERLRKQGHTPVGERLRFGKDPGAQLHKVIGVVTDARYRRVTETGDDIYVHHEQALAPTNYLVIRGTRTATELTNLVRQTVASIDANQTIAGVATLQELIDRDTARHRFNMILLLWFAGCALVLAAAGIYSVIAETVASRTKELAIKLALGARGSRLIVEMLSGALFVVMIGEAIGALGAFGLGRLAQELLYTVSPSDPAVLGAVVTFLFFISFLAALLPAWRATLLDPRSSLQAE